MIWRATLTIGAAIGSTWRPINTRLRRIRWARGEGRRRVIRGGSWIARGEFAARCANRAAYEPIQAIHSVGFRIAKDV